MKIDLNNKAQVRLFFIGGIIILLSVFVFATSVINESNQTNYTEQNETFVNITNFTLSEEINETQNSTIEENITEETLVIEDTNESTRFNTLTTNCSAGQQVWGVLDTGDLVCVADVGITYQGYYNSSLINSTEFEDQAGKLGLVRSWIDSLYVSIGTMLGNTTSEIWGVANNQTFFPFTGGNITGATNIHNNFTLDAQSKICNATSGCPAYIYHNGSGWVIRG